MKTFSENLIEQRKRAGLNQTELAEKANCTQQLISQYESGKVNHKPKYPLLSDLSKALNCHPDDLDPHFKYEDIHYQGLKCEITGNNKCPFHDSDGITRDIIGELLTLERYQKTKILDLIDEMKAKENLSAG